MRAVAFALLFLCGCHKGGCFEEQIKHCHYACEHSGGMAQINDHDGCVCAAARDGGAP